MVIIKGLYNYFRSRLLFFKNFNFTNRLLYSVVVKSIIFMNGVISEIFKAQNLPIKGKS